VLRNLSNCAGKHQQQEQRFNKRHAVPFEYPDLNNLIVTSPRGEAEDRETNIGFARQDIGAALRRHKRSLCGIAMCHSESKFTSDLYLTYRCLAQRAVRPALMNRAVRSTLECVRLVLSIVSEFRRCSVSAGRGPRECQLPSLQGNDDRKDDYCRLATQPAG
jgi:hypothetical protein